MKSFIERHKNVWDEAFVYSVLAGALFFAISLVINNLATKYAAERVSLPVTDFILSNIRVFDVDAIIIYGALLLIAFTIVVGLYEPKRIPFILKSLAMFIVIRSIFISLTHIGPFSPQVIIDPARISSALNFLGIGTKADLFFSGHTGMPFLLALIFWNNKIIRWIYLLTCLTFAVSVLLGHLHYSIDVFAAFFITYTIFAMSKYLFAKDWQLCHTV